MDIVTSSLFPAGAPGGGAYLDQVLELPKVGLLAVADAVKLGDEGRAGVKIALEGIRTSIERHNDVLDRFRRNPTDALRERVLGVMEDAMARAAQEVFAYARRREVRVAVDVVLLLESEAFVAHVGDGRVYLVRRGLVHQLTVDHTTAGDDVFATIDAEPGGPGASDQDRGERRVVRTLGAEPNVRVESLCMELAEHDRFVLCTWGVHHAIPDGVLHHHLLADPLPLIGTGLARAAPDAQMVGVAGQLGGSEPDILDAGRSRLAILAPMPLFAHCTERELRAVASATHPRRFASGTTLFRQNDPGTELYLVISGSVRIERDGTPIAVLGPGSNFGEMALLDEPRRSATTVAAEDCEVMVISRESFFAMLKGNPLLAVKILWNMLLRLSAHLRTTSKALAQATDSGAAQRQEEPVVTAPLVDESARRTVKEPPQRTGEPTGRRSTEPARRRSVEPAPPRRTGDPAPPPEDEEIDLLGEEDG